MSVINIFQNIRDTITLDVGEKKVYNEISQNYSNQRHTQTSHWWGIYTAKKCQVFNDFFTALSILQSNGHCL